MQKAEKMNEIYFIDTSKFSIDKFKNILKTKDILPGRIILKDKLDERFELLKSNGIDSIMDLLDTLKTKPKIEKYAKDNGLTIDYLTILRREANSYVSVPVKLIDLPFVETDIVHKLESNRIKDSKQFFDNSYNRKDREKLAQRLNLPLDKLLELVCLCDLVRITGVGPVFARIIYDSGIHSVREFLSFGVQDLCQRLIATNEEKGYTKAKFGISDIEYCVELGRNLPIVLEE